MSRTSPGPSASARNRADLRRGVGPPDAGGAVAERGERHRTAGVEPHEPATAVGDLHYHERPAHRDLRAEPRRAGELNRFVPRAPGRAENPRHAAGGQVERDQVVLADSREQPRPGQHEGGKVRAVRVAVAADAQGRRAARQPVSHRHAEDPQRLAGGAVHRDRERPGGDEPVPQIGRVGKQVGSGMFGFGALVERDREDDVWPGGEQVLRRARRAGDRAQRGDRGRQPQRVVDVGVGREAGGARLPGGRCGHRRWARRAAYLPLKQRVERDRYAVGAENPLVQERRLKRRPHGRREAVQVGRGRRELEHPRRGPRAIGRGQVAGRHFRQCRYRAGRFAGREFALRAIDEPAEPRAGAASGRGTIFRDSAT